MKIRHWFVFGVLGCAQLTAIAQQAPERQRPQDADAAVPALTYNSAFEGHAFTISDQDRTPDQAWRPANDQVAGADAGHAHHEPTKEAENKNSPVDAKPPVKHQHQHEGN